MTKQEQDKLLEEAKLRYPSGTIIKSMVSLTYKTIQGDFRYNENIFDSLGTCVYYENRWAEIIFKPEVKPFKDKPFYVVVTEENKEVLSKWLPKCRFKVGDIVGLYKSNYFPNLEKAWAGFNSSGFGNEITFEQFLELYPEYKEDKPKFEIGKWYKVELSKQFNHYIKFKSFDKDKAYLDGGYIHNLTKWDNGISIILGNVTKYELLTNLSEIQQYLPDCHVDKVATIPEYVECIKELTNIEIGKIYPVINKCIVGLYGYSTKQFKPSTKEAYDMQNKPSLVGRYVKALKDNCEGTHFKKGEYIEIVSDNDPHYEVTLKSYLDFCANISRKDLWQLMPIGFDPNKVEEEWVPEIGDWVTVKTDADCYGNDAYSIKGKTFKITTEINKKGFYGSYCIGYKDQFPGVFSLSEGGIYIKYLRPAKPHEIPIKSDDFVLPEKWCIKNTLENRPYIEKYRRSINYSPIEIDAKYKYQSQNYGECSIIGTEITFEQFKKYVLKEDVVISNMSTETGDYKLGKHKAEEWIGTGPITHHIKWGDIDIDIVQPPPEFWDTKLDNKALKTELELIPIKKLKTFNN